MATLTFNLLPLTFSSVEEKVRGEGYKLGYAGRFFAGNLHPHVAAGYADLT